MDKETEDRFKALESVFKIQEKRMTTQEIEIRKLINFVNIQANETRRLKNALSRLSGELAAVRNTKK